MAPRARSVLIKKSDEPSVVVKKTKKGVAVETPQVGMVSISSRDLFAEGHNIHGRQRIDISLIAQLMKASEAGPVSSNQGVNVGERQHPFDFSVVDAFKNSNVHHSSCVETRRGCMVGLGFQNDATKKKLDKLCKISAQDVLMRVAEDFCQRGNGLFEVVRDQPTNKGKITGLHALPARTATIYLENERYDTHWVIRSEGGKDRYFAQFGDLEGFIARNAERANANTVSEVIHIPASTSQNQFYGMPDWLPAVASIELVQCIHQDAFDFFLNRAVPEFMLFVLGKDIGKANMDEMKNLLKASIGLGNAHKSGVFNIHDSDVKIQLEKLALDSRGDGVHFATMNDALALQIVTAHRTPALLAGIQLPGKMAATNELPNALMGYQLLNIGPAQNLFEAVLDKTLGDPDLNGGLGLKAGDFKFRTITDEMGLAQMLSGPGAATSPMDTLARMKTPLASPAGQARDLKAGLKKELLDSDHPDVQEAASAVLGILAMKLLTHQAA